VEKLHVIPQIRSVPPDYARRHATGGDDAYYAMIGLASKEFMQQAHQ
jgi:hypothetical protein